MILECFFCEFYCLIMGRGISYVGIVFDVVQVGLKVCLINKYFVLDGDLFLWGFCVFGLGKLIGICIWGGIVGISGLLLYMDGMDICVLFFMSYDLKIGKWIIENYGVDLDILIDNDLVKEWNGEDQ